MMVVPCKAAISLPSHMNMDAEGTRAGVYPVVFFKAHEALAKHSTLAVDEVLEDGDETLDVLLPVFRLGHLHFVCALRIQSQFTGSSIWFAA